MNDNNPPRPPDEFWRGLIPATIAMVVFYGDHSLVVVVVDEPTPTPVPAPPVPPQAPPPSGLEGKIQTGVGIVKGLSLTNVLIIALLVAIAVPTYVIWKALDNDKLLDRFLSTYEEFASTGTGCVLRHVQQRGGPDMWGISSGFAFQGADRWMVSVILPHSPSNDEITTYCESLKLISDKMLSGGAARGTGGHDHGISQ